MSRRFDQDTGGSGDRLSNENGVSGIDVAQRTLGCWFNAHEGNSAQVKAIINIATEHTSGSFRCELSADGATGDIEYSHNWSGTDGVWRHSSGLTALDQWFHLAASYDRGSTANDPKIYVDGTNSVTENAAPTGSVETGEDSLRFGQDAGGVARISGRIAEAAMWDVILDDAEISALAAGYSPLFIRPQNLVWYVPLFGRTSPELELIQGAHLTVTNTTTDIHAPMVYPAAPFVPSLAAFVPPAPAPAAPAIGGDLRAGGESRIWVPDFVYLP